VSNFTFTVASSNTPVNLATPAILRSMALYVGLPAHAGITAPNPTVFAASNAAPITLPLNLTNSGGLPLAYSLTFTSSVPAWLTFSSTNGYVSKSGAVVVYLALNPAGLAPATYRFTIFFKTSDSNVAVIVLPVSFTIYAVPPASPRLTALAKTDSQFIFQLAGSTNVPYLVQSSTNLINWVPASTNILTGGPLNITNSVNSVSPAQFWRAVWQL
jgi:hypothetical protein